MPHNQPLILRTARKKDFIVPLGVLFLLVLVAAALGPQPLTSALAAILLIGAGRIFDVLCISTIQANESVLVIFPDARVRLTPADGKNIEGYLAGPQWSTRRLAVLRITTDNKPRFLLVLSARQAGDGYRRLRVWLGQNRFGGAGIEPAARGIPTGRV